MVESWAMLVSFPLCGRNREIFVGNGICYLQWEEADQARQSRWLRPRCEDSVSSPGNSSSSSQSCSSWRLHWKYVVSNMRNFSEKISCLMINLSIVCLTETCLRHVFLYLLSYYAILSILLRIFIVKYRLVHWIIRISRWLFRWYSRAIHRPAETVRVRRIPTRGELSLSWRLRGQRWAGSPRSIWEIFLTLGFQANRAWRLSVSSWPTRSSIRRTSSCYEETTSVLPSTGFTVFTMNVSPSLPQPSH